MSGVHIIWPERRFVPAGTISGWYHDAVANGEVDSGDGIIADSEWYEQAKALSDAGLITMTTNV
jgi:hypothetical protein